MISRSCAKKNSVQPDARVLPGANTVSVHLAAMKWIRDLDATERSGAVLRLAVLHQLQEALDRLRQVMVWYQLAGLQGRGAKFQYLAHTHRRKQTQQLQLLDSPGRIGGDHLERSGVVDLAGTVQAEHGGRESLLLFCCLLTTESRARSSRRRVQCVVSVVPCYKDETILEDGFIPIRSRSRVQVTTRVNPTLVRTR
ncbi:hypothetical protein EYF80_002093 [Liparis tanakae]|uniref:Uncharacterized protein n=1 Tax=Liparis tanakae TaxID=230148 RepID=A0A4Z2JC23_9TELE|nr:hypothetical protein EYF80_002093 [Liparis tanakae]